MRAHTRIDLKTQHNMHTNTHTHTLIYIREGEGNTIRTQTGRGADALQMDVEEIGPKWDV